MMYSQPSAEYKQHAPALLNAAVTVLQESINTAAHALAMPNSDPTALITRARDLIDTTATHTATHVQLCQAYARGVVRKLHLLQQVLERMMKLVTKEHLQRLQVPPLLLGVGISLHTCCVPKGMHQAIHRREGIHAWL